MLDALPGVRYLGLALGLLTQPYSNADIDMISLFKLICTSHIATAHLCIYQKYIYIFPYSASYDSDRIATH